MANPFDWLRDLGAGLSRVTERWVPDAWVICMMLTAIREAAATPERDREPRRLRPAMRPVAPNSLLKRGVASQLKTSKARGQSRAQPTAMAVAEASPDSRLP